MSDLVAPLRPIWSCAAQYRYSASSESSALLKSRSNNFPIYPSYSSCAFGSSLIPIGSQTSRRTRRIWARRCLDSGLSSMGHSLLTRTILSPNLSFRGGPSALRRPSEHNVGLVTVDLHGRVFVRGVAEAGGGSPARSCVDSPRSHAERHRLPPLQILWNITRRVRASGRIPLRTADPATQTAAKVEVHHVLGEQVGITKGKRLVRRVLSTNPPTAEVSFEDSGTLFGVAVNGMGTYTSVVCADGSLHGEGQGLEMTADGDAATWKGTGVGKFGPGGSVSYRGMLFFRTASQKLARLNNACVAFEYEVDASGATVSKMWEWK